MERERAERRAEVWAMLWEAVGKMREERSGGLEDRGCEKEDEDNGGGSEGTMKSRYACT